MAPLLAASSTAATLCWWMKTATSAAFTKAPKRKVSTSCCVTSRFCSRRIKMRRFNLWQGGLAALALATLTQCFTNRESEGQQLYVQQCANCHMDDGSGLRGLIPPLAGSDYLVRHREQLACLIRHGQQGEIVVNGVHYNRPMPGV